MAASQIKTTLQSVGKYTQKNPESYRSQPISLIWKSHDWFPHNASLYQRYLKTDFNGTFQGIKKKKKRKSLVKPESHLEHHKRSQTVPLSKQSNTQTRLQKAPSWMPNWTLNTSQRFTQGILMSVRRQKCSIF